MSKYTNNIVSIILKFTKKDVFLSFDFIETWKFPFQIVENMLGSKCNSETSLMLTVPRPKTNFTGIYFHPCKMCVQGTSWLLSVNLTPKIDYTVKREWYVGGSFILINDCPVQQRSSHPILFRSYEDHGEFNLLTGKVTSARLTSPFAFIGLHSDWSLCDRSTMV